MGFSAVLIEPMLEKSSRSSGYRCEQCNKEVMKSTADLMQYSTEQSQELNRNLRRILIVINCILLLVGVSGGPLISRLYFRHGGHHKWLASFLESAGFPIIIIPLSFSYFHRRNRDPNTKAIFITFRVFLACAFLGVMIGADNFLYAYGFSLLPVSTSSVLMSTQLAFTAFFAFLVVKQKFTPFSLNSVALLMVGAAILGLHANSDLPAGVSKKDYFVGFFLTLGAAALSGLVLPLVELTYQKAKQEVTYTLVMEMQFVMGFFATVFCAVGMLVNKEFQAIPNEATHFAIGATKYYMVLVFSAIIWQFCFLGTFGVIFCVDTLLAGVITALFIPVTETLGVILYNEKFGSEKGVALTLSLWGLASYSYGEYLDIKQKKKYAAVAAQTA